MALYLELLLLVVAIVFVWSWKQKKKRKSLPPGEFGWPVIGYMKPSKETMMEAITRLRKKHGDTFTWQMGGRTYVFLCDKTTMKNVLNNADVANRPDFFSFKVITDYKIVGIFNTSGEIWHNSRRFTMRHLRDMGFGKSSLENSVALEAKAIVEDFKNNLDKPTSIPLSLSTAVLNIIWKMVSDIRLKFDDPEILKLQQLLYDLFRELNGNVTYFDQFPYLEHIIPKCMYGLIGIDGYIDKSERLIKYIRTAVDDHRETLDEDNPRDFIDEFLIEQKKVGITNEAFSDENLEGLIIDLFTAGGETITMAIRGIILHLAKYPEIQAKIHREIDEAVSRDSLPGIEHKSALNYTEAVFHESQRCMSAAPITFPRTSSKPLNVNGFTLEKDTIVVGHVEGMHFDPKFWERPNEFYPEHFLDANGKFINIKDCYAPFSLGRRACPGESLAKLNIYLFGTALLQKYTFSAAPGEYLSTDRDPAQLFFYAPNDFKVIISERK